MGRKLLDMVTIWRDIQAEGAKSRGRPMNLPKRTSLVIGLDGILGYLHLGLAALCFLVPTRSLSQGG